MDANREKKAFKSMALYSAEVRLLFRSIDAMTMTLFWWLYY